MTARHPTVRLVGRVGLSRRLVMAGSAPIARSHRPICLGRPAPGSRDRPLGSLRCSFRCRFSARRLSRRLRSAAPLRPPARWRAAWHSHQPPCPGPWVPDRPRPHPPLSSPAPLQARGTSHAYTRSEKIGDFGDSREGKDGIRWAPLLKKSGGGKSGDGWDPVSPSGANQGELELEKSEPVMEWKATAPVSGCPRSPPASDSAAGSRC